MKVKGAWIPSTHENYFDHIDHNGTPTRLHHEIIEEVRFNRFGRELKKVWPDFYFGFIKLEEKK
jgi:hypothetical protein